MYIVIPPQGHYGDFATVTAVANTQEEAIAIAEKEGGVAYRASGYGEGSRVPRSAIDTMRRDGRLVERDQAAARPSVIEMLREGNA